MNKGLMVIDASNWGFCASSKKQLTVGDQDTQGVYYFLNMLRSAVSMFPVLTPVMVNDGRSWRYDFYPDYKASRDKEAVTKNEIEQKRVRLSYRSQKPLINKACELLGVRQMFSLNLEADDLAAILVKRYEGTDKRILLMSGDKDWIQLVRPYVTWMDVINDRRVGSATLAVKNKHTESIGLGYDDKKTGEWISVKNGQQWLECKALMGDKSDEIGGVGGIGDVGGIALLHKFGSVGNFLNQYADGTIDAAKVPKKLRDFADFNEKQEIFRRNMILMDLISTSFPKARGLKVVAGNFDLEGFTDFCHEWSFQSFLTSIEDWTAPFAAQAHNKEKEAA